MTDHAKRKRIDAGGKSYSASRKRKHEGSQVDEKLRSGPSSRKKSKSVLLQGKLFAVSTLAEASSEESPEGYSQIVSLCKDLGAQTTGQVHKRVDVVIATQSAVDGNTQRVRKAWKKGIPVVLSEWIQECLKQHHVVDMEPFKKSESKGTVGNLQLKEKAFKKKEKRSAANVADQTRTLDLGCCCVCHETSPNSRTECDWCVECSINRTYDRDLSTSHEEQITIDLGCCCVCHDNAVGRTECAWCIGCSVNQKYSK